MKGTSNIQHPTSNLEVVNKEQGELIDRANLYLSSYKTAHAHCKGYALLAGTTLNQLKEITPHGEFEAVKAQLLPEFSRTWINRIMQFAEWKKFKCLVDNTFGKGQLLLDLPDAEKEKLFEEVDEVTGQRTIDEIAFEVLKKRHKDKRATPTPEEAAEADRHQDNEYAKTVLGTLNQAIHETGQRHLANCDRELLDLIEDARIELGKVIAPMLKRGKKGKA